VSPGVLERLLSELDARILPATDAAIHRTPLVGPDGRELTPAEALAWRAHAHDAAMRVYLEIARAPGPTLGIPDLRPIPLWAQAGAVAVVVGLSMGQGFLGLLLLIVWLKL
jgi:hypothetical protein